MKLFNVAKSYEEVACLLSNEGVRAVLAESFERIHRSNLVGMGVIPLQYHDGDSAESLRLTGHETFTIDLPDDLQTGQDVTVHVSC